MGHRGALRKGPSQNCIVWAVIIASWWGTWGLTMAFIGDLALEQLCWACLGSPHALVWGPLPGLAWSWPLFLSPTQFISFPGTGVAEGRPHASYRAG